MIENIYYLIAIIFIIDETLFLLMPQKRFTEMQGFTEMYKDYHSVPWESLPENYKKTLRRRILIFIYLIWMVLGLFTSQAFIFGVFVTLNMVVFSPISKMIRNKTQFLIKEWVVAFLSVLFLSFVLYNKYYLHIDFWGNFRNWITTL